MSFPFLQPYAGLSNSLQTAQAAGGPGGTVGGWVELARTTLGSAGDDITVSSLPDKRYYMILSNSIPTGNVDFAWRTGNGSVDTGNNYASRSSSDGGAEVTVASTNRIRAGLSGTISTPQFHMGFWSNLSSKEKLFIGHSMGQNAAGAGTAPTRRENVGKWTSTSNPLDTLTATNAGSGSHNTGSELVVLGWDQDDTHTSNFWEELASTTTLSAGDTLSSGTISAKKYLWVQATYKNDGAADINAGPRFNSDSGNNYSSRYSFNGGAETARTSRNKCDIESGSQEHKFCNMFIINNASNEKLVITHLVTNNGSGAGNAPQRWESVSKWANTSSQITQIDFPQLDAGDYAAGAELRVWGAD